MATWVIGDIQGCFEAFDALLETIDPDPGTDRIWLAGDLVNRGPDSLGVLRRAMRMGAECVLGNHDLHLLAVAQGARPCAASDTLGPVLEAPDREPLLDWLRRRPLLHHDEEIGWTMVHGGLPPTGTSRPPGGGRKRSKRSSPESAPRHSSRTSTVTRRPSRKPPNAAGVIFGTP